MCWRSWTPASIASAVRNARHDALQSTTFDVVVIGGGITGPGIAREATRRGLSVALVEADDFAAGTSSRSSKLIHGGLRYLAMGDVPLVRETALERKRVHALAPHLAEPCWMLTPARSWAGLLKFRAGIGTYEKLGAVDEVDRHQTWRHDELERNEPLLRRDRRVLQRLDERDAAGRKPRARGAALEVQPREAGVAREREQVEAAAVEVVHGGVARAEARWLPTFEVAFSTMMHFRWGIKATLDLGASIQREQRERGQIWSVGFAPSLGLGWGYNF